MAILDYNTSLQEQVPMTHRRQAPVVYGEDLYKATGEQHSREWSGPWGEILRTMQELPASMSERLDATATRVADGDFGTLRATWTLYEFAGANGEDAATESPPGSSRANPQYEIQNSAVQEPILTHPKLAYLPLNYIKALKMLMDGYTLEDTIYDSGYQREVTIEELLENIPTPEAKTLILQGVTHYLSPQVVVTCRYAADTVPQFAQLCSIVTELPGPFPQPAGGRNWLFEGPSVSMDGPQIMVSETYRLSGPGGWSPFLYTN